MSETLADCFSTWREQGKEAYREMIVAEELFEDETGNHQGIGARVNKIHLIIFFIAQAFTVGTSSAEEHTITVSFSIPEIIELSVPETEISFNVAGGPGVYQADKPVKFQVTTNAAKPQAGFVTPRVGVTYQRLIMRPSAFQSFNR